MTPSPRLSERQATAAYMRRLARSYRRWDSYPVDDDFARSVVMAIKFSLRAAADDMKRKARPSDESRT